MPELPEIETVRLQLTKCLIGNRLIGIEVRNLKSLQGEYTSLIGKKVVGVRRVAKVLLVDFEDDLTAAFHFKMSGQLIYDEYKSQGTNPKKQLKSKIQIQNIESRVVGGHPTKDFVGKLPSSHTRVVFEFDKGTLFFNDQRKFGWVIIDEQEKINDLRFMKKIGPEPFDIEIKEFAKKLAKTKKAIKTAIMDQEIISGVGNIYANDALWEASINPQVPSHKLQMDQVSLLLEKIILVLNEGIKYGGATMADAKYMDLHGLGGKYQEHFRTYAQAGKNCKRCGEIIVKTVIGGRGTFYCPECQK